MPLWAKIDVEMPTDPKLLGQPVATRLLWLCLICLAKQQDAHGEIRGFDATLLAGRFNIPRKAVVEGLTHYQKVSMAEVDGDGTIRLVNFEKRQGTEDTANERSARYYDRHRETISEKRKVSRSESHGVLTPLSHAVSRETVSLEKSREEIEKEKATTRTTDLAQSAEKRPPAPESAFAAYVQREWPDIKSPEAFEARALAAFPAVDAVTEARKARGWEMSDPRRRKVNHGRFLWNWLSTAQQGASRGISRLPQRPGAANLQVDNEAHNAEPAGRKFL